MKRVLTEEQKARKREKDRERREKVKANPELHAQQVARAKASRVERMADPERIAHRRAVDKASKARRMANPAYASATREEGRRYMRERRAADPERFRAEIEEYRVENKEKVLARQQERRKEKMADPILREQTKTYNREYRLRPEVIERERLRKQDPAHRLFLNTRARLWIIRKFFQLGRIPRNGKKRFREYFGAESEVVVAHFASQFTPEMTWENCGKVWQIDHIIPISAGRKNIELLTKLNHYKNLRPLLAAENLRKGDKMPNFFPEGVPFTPEECGWSPPPLKERGPTEVRVQDAGD